VGGWVGGGFNLYMMGAWAVRELSIH